MPIENDNSGGGNSSSSSNEHASAQQEQQKEAAVARSIASTPAHGEASRKRKLGESVVTASNNAGTPPSEAPQQQHSQAVQQQQQQQQQPQPMDTTSTRYDDSSENSTAGDGMAESLIQPDGWRVKLYRLNADGTWDDCGTGRIVCNCRPLDHNHHNSNNNDDNTAVAVGSDEWLFTQTGEWTLCVHAEVTPKSPQPHVLLRTRILLREAYQRQGDNIITWCEPEPCFATTTTTPSSFPEQDQSTSQDTNSNDAARSKQDENNSGPGGGGGGGSGGVDLALSFQDNAGCLKIWGHITRIQQRAADLMRSAARPEDIANQVAMEHHNQIQKQQQRKFWSELNANNAAMDMEPAGNGFGGPAEQAVVQLPVFPDPPTLDNLKDVALAIDSLQHSPPQQHAQQREALGMWVGMDDCAYLKKMLELLEPAETAGDKEKLETLAGCIKKILLINESTILEVVVRDENLFVKISHCMEYDPDLREKANHRWFLKEKAKFRTVLPIKNSALVLAIHRSFRVNFLRDTLLRPTMDESALTTLSSLQSFTHTDVVKGVMMSECGEEVPLEESYLVSVMRLLAVELHTLGSMDWKELQDSLCGKPRVPKKEEAESPQFTAIGNDTAWRQYLAPQDDSIESHRIRRRGCLSFLRELFNMVRMSLDKFFPVVCTVEIHLTEPESSDTSEGTPTTRIPFPKYPLTLPSLMANVLSDPNAEDNDKQVALEIVAGIAMHDPSLIRRCCLKFHEEWTKEESYSSAERLITRNPIANRRGQVVFCPPSYDLLGSLLYLLDVDSDAGVLLQVTEIMRILLDTDVVTSDQISVSSTFTDEREGVPPGAHLPLHDQHNQPIGVAAMSADQKEFLSLFYENYMPWIVAPFHLQVVRPLRLVPSSVLLSPQNSPLMTKMNSVFKEGVSSSDFNLKIVPNLAMRASFAVELLSFCVRAHLTRMKFFLCRSKVLGYVLKLLHPKNSPRDRCLKLAALRLFRSVLSVNDETYNRHIIQNNLFEPVFQAFRANPVGDNLVASSVVEMCDYLVREPIASLIEHVATKHLAPSRDKATIPSLEEVSSPYVSTLTHLREVYESGINGQRVFQVTHQSSPGAMGMESPTSARRILNLSNVRGIPRQLSGRALEEQKLYRAAEAEESYFDSDDDDSPHGAPAERDMGSVQIRVDEIEMPLPSRPAALSPVRFSPPQAQPENSSPDG